METQVVSSGGTSSAGFCFDPGPEKHKSQDHPFITLCCGHCGQPLRVRLGCGDRTCSVCRKKWFGYHFKALLDCVTSWKAVYFLTLTTKNIPDEAFGRQDVQRIRKSLEALRRRSRSIDGGFYVVQATNRGKGWHLHLHVLYDGTFLPKKWISDTWSEITAGSYIVDIRLVQDPKTAVRYLLSDFLQTPRIRAEDETVFNLVFKGSRLVQPFGKYRKTKFRTPFECPECGECCWTTIEELLGEKRAFRKGYEDDG